MTESLKILDTLLHSWTDKEVTQAWSMIAAEEARRKKLKTFDNKMRLSKGHKVSFVGKKLGPVTGEVIRVKYKKALINVSGQTWDVPLSMLTKVNG
jgi:hypothetical protein